MNTHFFATVARRWIAPTLLAGATLCGTLGISSVASAEQRVAVGVRGPVGVARPGARVVIRGGERVVSPAYYGGPVWAPGYAQYWGPEYYRGFGRPGFAYGRGGFRGWGGERGLGGFHNGGGFHGGGAHGGGAHGGGAHGGHR